jgi:hypothetical protein
VSRDRTEDLPRTAVWQWVAVAAVFVVMCCGGAGLLVYQVLRGVPCTPPAGEEQLLSDYRAQAVLGVMPAGVASPAPLTVGRYCDDVGVDSPHRRTLTSVAGQFESTGYWPAQRLFDLYGPVATTSGWTFVEMADHTLAGQCGLTVTHAGTPYCDGTGLVYCKMIDSVPSMFEVTSDSRPDIPNSGAHFVVRIEDRRVASSCSTVTWSPPP